MYIAFAQEVYTFQSIGIYVSFGRYIPFFYVMYTARDEGNMILRKFYKEERYRECLSLAARTDNHFTTIGVCATSNMFRIAQLPLICLRKFR